MESKSKFVTPTKPKLKTHHPGSRFVDSHHKSLARQLLDFNTQQRNCREILQFYQAQCLKFNRVESNRIFKEAKMLITIFFNTLDDAKKMITELESNHFDEDVLNVMSLHKFEQLSRPIQERYTQLHHDKQKKVNELIEKNYDNWSNCYVGRWWYRSICERNRDEGHVAAFYIFKSATLIGKIIKVYKSL